MDPNYSLERVSTINPKEENPASNRSRQAHCPSSIRSQPSSTIVIVYRQTVAADRPPSATMMVMMRGWKRSCRLDKANPGTLHRSKSILENKRNSVGPHVFQFFPQFLSFGVVTWLLQCLQGHRDKSVLLLFIQTGSLVVSWNMFGDDRGFGMNTSSVLFFFLDSFLIPFHFMQNALVAMYSMYNNKFGVVCLFGVVCDQSFPSLGEWCVVSKNDKSKP